MAYFNIQPYNIIRRATHAECVCVMYTKCELTEANTIFFCLLFLSFIMLSVSLISKSILPRTLFRAIGCYLSRNCLPRRLDLYFYTTSLSHPKLSPGTLCIHTSRLYRVVENVCPKQQNVVAFILISCCCSCCCC